MSGFLSQGQMMATSSFRLGGASKVGLPRSCERRPTGSSRGTEANFGDVFIPAFRADRRRFLSAISNLCSPNLTDGGEKKKQNNRLFVCTLVGTCRVTVDPAWLLKTNPALSLGLEPSERYVKPPQVCFCSKAAFFLD